MLRLLLALGFGLTLLAPVAFRVPEAHCATCTGSLSCRACKNCKYCQHCGPGGGSCGVCRK